MQELLDELENAGCLNHIANIRNVPDAKKLPAFWALVESITGPRQETSELTSAAWLELARLLGYRPKVELGEVYANVRAWVPPKSDAESSG
jgi:hypothetical protein